MRRLDPDDPVLMHPEAFEPRTLRIHEFLVVQGLLLFGLWMVIAPLDELVHVQRFRAGAIVVQGEIVSLGPATAWLPGDGFAAIEFTGVVRIPLRGGTEELVPVSLDLFEAEDVAVGDSIPVAYHPTAPNRAVYLLGPVAEHWGRVAIAFVGLALSWLLAALAYRLMNRKQWIFTVVIAPIFVGWLVALPPIGDDAYVIRSAARTGNTLRSRHLANRDLPASINFFGDSELILAVAAGDEGRAAELVAAGAGVDHRNVEGNSALMIAARDDLAPIVGLLLEAGAEPDLVNGEGFTALMFAARAGARTVVERLLAEGAAITGASPLGPATEPAAVYQARRNEHDAIADLIDGHSASVEAFGAALRAGRLPEARRLINQGVSPNNRFGSEYTPVLLSAAGRGDRSAFNMLRDAGAIVDATDDRGRDLCFYADRGGDQEIGAVADRLLDCG